MIAVLMLFFSALVLTAQCPTFLKIGTVIQGTYTVLENEWSMWTPVFQGDISNTIITIPVPSYQNGKIQGWTCVWHQESANTWNQIQDVFWLYDGEDNGIARYDLTLSKAGCPNDYGKLFVHIYNNGDFPQIPPNPPPRGK